MSSQAKRHPAGGARLWGGSSACSGFYNRDGATSRQTTCPMLSLMYSSLSPNGIVVLNAFSAVAQSVGAVIADLRGLIATTRDLSDIVYDLTPDDIAYQGPQILTELFHISDELIRTTNDAEEAAAQGPLPPPAADAVNDLYTEFAFTYLYLAGLINQNILDVDDLGAGGEVVQHFVLVELMHQEGLIDALSDAIESLIPDSAMVNATNALNSINGTIAKAAAAMNVSS